ncbi:GNAT family N-acetyltransferase [Shouchella patagoniensis]|uniref:GNAT family N-acetyltransferase n=1 Tax=Shouchella patagoniensis TaxID=228576 RepID=UPI0009951C3A|nr:GNAT family N-acetyltransferase [Shouchella patagoniensis]
MTELTALVLRPLLLEDYPVVLKWSKDELFCRANGWELGRDADEVYRWWDLCVHLQSSTIYRKGIELDGKLIGYVDLANSYKGVGELGIAIGETDLWGKGIGQRAARMMIDYMAMGFGITTFKAETNEANERSRRMLERIGFKESSRNGMEEYCGKSGILIQYTFSL